MIADLLQIRAYQYPSKFLTVDYWTSTINRFKGLLSDIRVKDLLDS